MTAELDGSSLTYKPRSPAVITAERDDYSQTHSFIFAFSSGGSLLSSIFRTSFGW